LTDLPEGRDAALPGRQEGLNIERMRRGSRGGPGAMRVVAVIPAFNESGTIADVAARARRQLEDVVVVDDASADDTAGRLAGSGVVVLRNDANRGKGGSLWRGMAHALALGADAVVTLDADGQHRPEDIPALIAEAEARPGRIVIGARRLSREQAPRARRFANAFADFWISWAAGHPVEDSQSGFRLYPAELLRDVAIPHDRDRGFVFESEILIEAARRGWLTCAVPIETIYRTGGRPSYFRPVMDIVRITRMVGWRILRRGMYPLGLLRALGVIGARSSRSLD